MEPRPSPRESTPGVPHRRDEAAPPGPGPGADEPRSRAPRAPAPAPVAVLVHEAGWRRHVRDPEAVVRRAARVAADAAAAAASTVVLSRDREVRRLNARHRGRDKPTNVLTFETHGVPGAGDIVLALGVVRREAREAGRPVEDHLAHLVVHGLLHLRGHDHGGAGEARRMEREEARLLSRIGVPNPWKPRPR